MAPIRTLEHANKSFQKVDKHSTKPKHHCNNTDGVQGQNSFYYITPTQGEIKFIQSQVSFISHNTHHF